LQPLSNLVVATVVGLTTELTIKWNALRGVNSLSSAGQTIPFIVGVRSLVRVFYVYSDPMFKHRFGHDTQATPSLEAEDPPGPVAFEVMPVPYSAPMEWIDPEPEATTTWAGRVEEAPR
jgi:hypothetical protein